jgi:hypothetical protein
LASVSTAILPSLSDQVRRLNDLTGDVLLVALAQWLYEGEEGNAWITVDQILRYRGIKPKINKAGGATFRGGYRIGDKLAIANSFEQLDRIWIELIDVQSYHSEIDRSGQKRKKATSARSG